MTNAIESFSFGRYLKAERLEKGIDLKHISKETKINHETLVLIEMEDHGRLPAEVFTKGFLRVYAAVIGADRDEVIRRYVASREVFTEAGQLDVELHESQSQFWRHLLISIGILLVIILIAIWIGYGLKEPLPAPVTRVKQETAIVVSDKNVSPPVSPLPEIEKNVVAVIPEALSLVVEAIDHTWMKVIIDDRSPKEYSLKPPDRLALEATAGFKLLIGNGAGVRLLLNGESVTISGKTGEVVSLKLP